MAAHTIPSHTLTGHNLKILATDNIELLRKMGNDPLIIKKTRVDAVYGVMQLMDTAYERAPLVKTPALILYGGCDQVIPSEPIARSLEHFHAPVTFIYYPEGYHMLLRDLQGGRVMTDILSWINKPQAPVPSGFAVDSLPERKALDHCRHIVLTHPSGGSRNSG
jgi:alpha-beta hydrolase superfamily lysophospholipase